AEAVERPARDELGQLAEQHEAEIAVEALRARLVLGRLAVDLLVDEFLGALAGEEVEAPLAVAARDLPEVRPPGCETGAVCEEVRSEEHTSELQSRLELVCRLL